jgi:hypothetical protein
VYSPLRLVAHLVYEPQKLSVDLECDQMKGVFGMTMRRLLSATLITFAVISVNPIWAQVGSTPAESTINNSGTSVSSDWAKQDVRVPNVVGLWPDEAKLVLIKAGLRVGEVREETSTSVAHHHVISESPAAGWRNVVIYWK